MIATKKHFQLLIVINQYVFMNKPTTSPSLSYFLSFSAVSTGKRVFSLPSSGCNSAVMLNWEVAQATTPSEQAEVSFRLHSTIGLSLNTLLYISKLINCEVMAIKNAFVITESVVMKLRR